MKIYLEPWSTPVERLWPGGRRIEVSSQLSILLSHNRSAMDSSRLSLLGLPVEIRTNIFRHAGLVRKFPVGLSQETIRLWRLRRKSFGLCDTATCSYDPDGEVYLNETPLEEECSEEEFPCDNDDTETHEPTDVSQKHFAFKLSNDAMPLPCVHARFPIEMLLVCRQFYDEASRILYGENVFYIDCLDRFSVRQFINLSPDAISSITILHILFGHDYSQLGRFFGHHLSHNESSGQAALQLWSFLVNSLAQRLRPRTTKIVISCYVKDVETLDRFLSPLTSLPPLRRVAFDVGQAFCYSTERTIVESKLQRAGAGLTMPYTELSETNKGLPFSVRQKILSYTGPAVHSKVKNPLALNGGIPGIQSDRLDSSPRLFRACCGTCDRSFGCCRCSRCGTYSSTCSCVSLRKALLSIDT